MEENRKATRRGELVLKLYDGAIDSCQRAMELFNKNPGDFERLLQKGYAIINELRFALDFSVAPDLCSSLDNLYRYMEQQIAESRKKMNPEPLRGVVKLLSTLRGAWDIVINGNKGVLHVPYVSKGDMEEQRFDV
jgi:flagellar protein FliS